MYNFMTKKFPTCKNFFMLSFSPEKVQKVNSIKRIFMNTINEGVVGFNCEVFIAHFYSFEASYAREKGIITFLIINFNEFLISRESRK